MADKVLHRDPVFLPVLLRWSLLTKLYVIYKHNCCGKSRVYEHQSPFSYVIMFHILRSSLQVIVNL